VNLERPLRMGDFLGGHIVQGHVDGIGLVVACARAADTSRIRVEWQDPRLAPYLIAKGSVAVDGVSLTVAALDEGAFEVMVIPHTLAVTTLGATRRGRRVNLEMDMIGKCVLRAWRLGGRPAGRAPRRATRRRAGRYSLVTIDRRDVSVGQFATIEEAIEEIRAGRMLVVGDDEDRENEGGVGRGAAR